MANPRRTIYVVYVGCKTEDKFIWFDHADDFITENYKIAEDEFFRLKAKWQRIDIQNISSPELDFIRVHKSYRHNISVHITEVTPNGESTTLKCAKIFQN